MGPLPDLRGFFPQAAEWEVRELTIPGDEEVSAAERAVVAHAAERRRREFLAGRAAARRALARLGVHGHDLLVGAAREPLWPPGVVGSLSHDADCCVAVAASRARLAGIGVDCAPDRPLPQRLWARIATPAELAWASGFLEPQRGRWLRLIFSAKEAFYKYQRPLSGRFLGFADATVEPDAATESFTIRSGLSGFRAVRGAWRRSAGRLVCLVHAAAPQA